MEKGSFSKEISARKEPVGYDNFVQVNPVQGSKYINAGLFYNSDNNYAKVLSCIFQRLIGFHEKVLKNEKFSENEAKEIRRLFHNLLEEKDFKTNCYATYSRDTVNSWRKGFKVAKEMIDGSLVFNRHTENKKFYLEEMKVGDWKTFKEKGGLVFLALTKEKLVESYCKRFELPEDIKAEEIEIREERLLEWIARTEILKEWLAYTSGKEREKRINEYLLSVKEVVDLLEYVFMSYYTMPPLQKLFYYLIPVKFDKIDNLRIVSTASLFKRTQETKRELWQSIKKDLGDEYKDLEAEFENFVKERGKGRLNSVEDIQQLLEQALDERFLNELRESWKRFIVYVAQKQGSAFTGKALVVENEKQEQGPWFTYGQYLVPNLTIEFVIYYEDGIQDREIDALIKNLQAGFKYAKNITVRFWTRKLELENLFFNEKVFNLIKSGKDEFKPEDTKDLMLGFYCFIAWLHGLWNRYQKKNETLQVPLLVLNTDTENGGSYSLWSYVQFIRDYYGVPVQVITRRFLNRLANEEVKKNFLISLYKDLKILRFNFGGLSIPEKLTIYVVLERPSPSFNYDKDKLDSVDSAERHTLCEVYRITVKGNTATVEVEDKFLIMGLGYNLDASELEEFIKNELEKNRHSKEDVRVCFIKAHRNSYLEELYKRFALYREKLFVLSYKELKTAYVSQGKEEAFHIMYAEDSQVFLKELNPFLELEEGKTMLGIKPAAPPRYKDFHHPALQFFFTEKVGFEKEEKYKQRKDLLLFTIVALSMFESESAFTPLAKLDIYSKKKGTYLKIHRKDKRTKRHEDYYFELLSVLMEMLEFVKHLPGKGPP